LKTGKNLFLYIIFYLLFSPDTWRILIGLVSAILIAPRAAAGYGLAAQTVVWLMILALGYVLSAPVGKFISKRLSAAMHGLNKSR
jgi:hypothetical protein